VSFCDGGVELDGCENGSVEMFGAGNAGPELEKHGVGFSARDSKHANATEPMHLDAHCGQAFGIAPNAR